VYTLPDDLWEVTDILEGPYMYRYLILIGKCPPPPIHRDILKGATSEGLCDWGTYYKRCWHKTSKRKVLIGWKGQNADRNPVKPTFYIGRIEATMKPIDSTKEEIDASFLEAMIADVSYSLYTLEGTGVYTLILNKEGELIALYYTSTMGSASESSARYRPRRGYEDLSSFETNPSLYIRLNCPHRDWFLGGWDKKGNSIHIIILKIVGYVVAKMKRLNLPLEILL
jgi:hypothetical protein